MTADFTRNRRRVISLEPRPLMSAAAAYNPLVLALRAVWAVAVVGIALLLLDSGLPLGAAAVVVAGVLVRRSAESGRVARLRGRYASIRLS